MNNQWNLDQVIISKRCLCFRSNYTLTIQAQLNKHLFFPDEKVLLDFQVDNSRSERDIKEINCTLKQTVTIRRADKVLQTVTHELHMIEFLGIARKQKRHQKDQLVFDLASILAEYNQISRRGKKMVEEVKRKSIKHQQSLWQSGNQKSLNSLPLQPFIT